MQLYGCYLLKNQLVYYMTTQDSLVLPMEIFLQLESDLSHRLPESLEILKTNNYWFVLYSVT